MQKVTSPKSVTNQGINLLAQYQNPRSESKQSLSN